MLFSAPLPFIEEYVNFIDNQLSIIDKGLCLSNIQRRWLSVCLMGIFSTNTICWSRFQRASLGTYQDGALSWMFGHSDLPWDLFLTASSRAIMKAFGITEGVLVVDDSDRKRAKVTTKIPTYKIYDKKTGGYFNGETVVVLLLVTDKITIPVGFEFYRPDPQIANWKKQKRDLKAKGVSRGDLPKSPKIDSRKYPTKSALADKLLQKFKNDHPSINIKAVVADNHYGNALLMNDVAAKICPQMLSELKCNQKIHRPRNHKTPSQNQNDTNEQKAKNKCKDDLLSLEDYFKNRPFTKMIVKVRGQGEQVVWFNSARLFVESHGAKRLVIALHYDNQDKAETRYLVATDLSWRTQDVIQAFTLRWLVEVFFEDLKVYEGWGQLAKQSRDDGSRRVLILSLLLDHCLFFYGPNKIRLENKQPAATVGSMIEHIRVQALVECVKKIIQQSLIQDPTQKLADMICGQFTLKPSKKHLHGLSPGHLAPSPSLQRRFPPAMALCP